ncbi:MAG: hypothetical protein WKF41_07530 [Gaiellaceae bacterium]
MTSSASTRIRPGRHPIDAAMKGLEIDPGEHGEPPLELGKEATPEGERTADEVLPRPALRLAEPE